LAPRESEKQIRGGGGSNLTACTVEANIEPVNSRIRAFNGFSRQYQCDWKWCSLHSLAYSTHISETCPICHREGRDIIRYERYLRLEAGMERRRRTIG
jgi:hypothetical protein